jgi:hypothetical protein
VDKRNFYYSEIVTASAMNEAFDGVESAIRAVSEDNDITGIVSGFGVTEQAPPAMAVDVGGPGIAYDKDGKRLSTAATTTAVDCSTDEYGVSTTVTTPGESRYLGIFVRFLERSEDPEIDGNGVSVYTRSYEDIEIFVRQGASAVGPSRVALLDNAILLADVLLAFGSTTVTTGMLSVTRREDWLRKVGASLGTKAFGTARDFISDLFDEVDAISGGGGIAHTYTSTWFGAVAVGTFGGVVVADVTDALNAIPADLAVNGAGAGGADLVGAQNYSTTYVSWASASVQTALEACAAATNGHIAGGAPNHNAVAILTPTTIAITGTAQDITDANLDLQLTTIGTRLSDRVYRTQASSRTDACQATQTIGNEEDADYLLTAPFVRGLRGSPCHPKKSLTEIAQGYWPSVNALHPYLGSNRFYYDNVPLAGMAVVSLPHAVAAEFPEMTRRGIFVIGTTTNNPYAKVFDPISMISVTYAAADFTSGLPSGSGESWQCIDVCGIGSNEVVCLFRNTTPAPTYTYRLQAYALSESLGIGTATVKSGWPATGTAMPGTGNVAAAGHAHKVIVASASRLAVANCHVATTSTCISIVNMSTGAITASGSGDATSSANRHPSGAITSDGSNVYFCTYDGGTDDVEADSAQIAAPGTGAVSSAFPLSIGANLSLEQSFSACFDGNNVWFVKEGGDVAVIDIFSDALRTLDGSSAFSGNVRNCCFDGVNVWIQELNSDGLVFAHAFRANAMRPVNGELLERCRVDRALMMYETRKGDITYTDYMGRMMWDGDTMWMAPTNQAALTGLTGYVVGIRGSAFR